MKYSELSYMGHPSQKYRAELVRLCGGKGDGMRLLQIDNGNGLNLTLVPDRCLDPYRLSFRGDNYGFMSPCGLTAPTYYSDKGADFLRTFTAGFMTTCGLTFLGGACTDQGEELGMHGRINAAPAEELCWYVEEQDGEDVIVVRARMEEGRLFAEKLSLTRTVRIHTAENKIDFEDVIANEGGEEQPFMLLYHMNMGYPLLDENAEVFIPAEKTVSRDPRAEEGIDCWNRIDPPEQGFAEQCYYHTVKKDENGWGSVGLFNNKLQKGVKISFDTAILHDFTEWKQLGERDYVLGLEPSNCKVDGRDKARERGELEFIGRGEKKTVRYSVKAVCGEEGKAELLSLLG